MLNEITRGSDADVLANLYTKEIGDYCKAALPVTLSNDEYLSRISAIIVALNRLLAEYVVTSAHVHECDLGDFLELIADQFAANVNHALQSIVGEGSTRQ